MRSSGSVAAALLSSACVGGGRPELSSAGYEAVGAATWYGAAFAGRSTASGARFNPDGFTAAHRTLPFGTMVKVTALDTGRRVRVVINDRGPTDRARLIDLSRAAADALGGVRHLSRVRVRVVAAKHLPRGERREAFVGRRIAMRDAAVSAGYDRRTDPNLWNL